MYLYHFCAIWKLLDIKGRSIILGEPLFLGGDSSLPLLPRYWLSWQPGATVQSWLHPTTRTQLLLTPPEQRPAQNGLFLRMPLDNPKQTITIWTWQIPPNGELMENIPRLRVQNLASFRPLTAHNMGTYFNYSKVTLTFSSIFFFSPFCYSLLGLWF